MIKKVSQVWLQVITKVGCVVLNTKKISYLCNLILLKKWGKIQHTTPNKQLKLKLLLVKFWLVFLRTLNKILPLYFMLFSERNPEKFRGKRFHVWGWYLMTCDSRLGVAAQHTPVSGWDVYTLANTIQSCRDIKLCHINSVLFRQR